MLVRISKQNISYFDIITVKITERYRNDRAEIYIPQSDTKKKHGLSQVRRPLLYHADSIILVIVDFVEKC